MNIQEAINKNESSLNELVAFYDQSKDEHNKQFLNGEIIRLKSKIDEFKKSLQPNSQVIRYRTIENYSWDQSNDLIKIYLNRNDFSKEEIQKESCKVQLEDNGHTVIIMVENAKLTIKRLSHPIEVLVDDFVKITKSFVIISLKKMRNQKWNSLQKVMPSVKPDFKPEENEDPTQSMMSLMKKMYDEGDDEMKRMINKAWCEKKDSNAFM